MIGIRVKSCRHKVALRRLRKAAIASVVVIIGCGFALNEITAHSSQISTQHAIEIVTVSGGDEQVRHQAHFVLDQVDRQSRKALALDAAKPGPLGKGCMIRLARRATDIIADLRELEKEGGEVGSSASRALQLIAKEAHN